MSFAALLNDFCTIWERVQSVDADTGEQIFQTEKAAENVPCAFQNGGGTLDRSGRLITGSDRDRVYLFPLHFELKKMTHMIEVRGERFRISEIKDMGGRKRYLRLELERTALYE